MSTRQRLVTPIQRLPVETIEMSVREIREVSGALRKLMGSTASSKNKGRPGTLPITAAKNMARRLRTLTRLSRDAETRLQEQQGSAHDAPEDPEERVKWEADRRKAAEAILSEVIVVEIAPITDKELEATFGELDPVALADLGPLWKEEV